MTEKRATQAGVEALYRVVPEAGVTQAGVEYLHRVVPGVEVAQAGVEYLHRVQPGHTITQAGVEYLHKAVPCSTRWAQIWTIMRTDGEVYRFTSLDRELEYPPGSGILYDACDSLVPSASQAVSEVDAAGTMDLSGAIGADGITEHDLYAGLFDGADVEAWLVPWRGAGSARALLSGSFGAIEQTPTGFKLELEGDGAKLMQTPLVRTVRPSCWKQFGDRFCQKDVEPLTVTGTVDIGNGVRAFTDTARAEPANFFRRGVVTFTSGLNAGVSAEVKEHAAGGQFELWPRLPYAIAAGDAYSMVPGCSNLMEAADGTNGCTAWGNLVNYGGFPSIPTKDKLTAAAVQRDS